MTSSAETVLISELMDRSGVKFGTSGARGLVSNMTDLVCYAYTLGFLQYLEMINEVFPGNAVGIAYDFRPSSTRIVNACCQAIYDSGHIPINTGPIPTPAIALYGISHNIPTLMITGSHIPDDRNGIKFYRQGGEILKIDEQAIRMKYVKLPLELFDENGMITKDTCVPAINREAYSEYIKRYTRLLPDDALRGMRIAVYQHSSVASSIILELLCSLGADTIALGYSDVFIPVDTEAIREKDISLAKGWAVEHQFDAIVSTDGDGDRPLIGDETGTWLRGDIIGILCAHYLSADIVVTPISSNTAVERFGKFKKVIRTRIGSPYVIEAMQQATHEGLTVAGYEANGGFLTNTTATVREQELPPLPTRDAILPILAILHLCAQKKIAISKIISDLPARFTCSNRIEGIAKKVALKKIEEIRKNGAHEFLARLSTSFQDEIGETEKIDMTDGLRITLTSGNIFHIRPSGNAPELRCYTESSNMKTAKILNQECIAIMESWREN